MKTIQETLKNYDREKLYQSYIYTYGPKLWEISDEDGHSIKEYKEAIKNNINHFLDYFSSVIPKSVKKEEECYLIAYHKISSEITENVDFTMIAREDFDKENPSRYSFILADSEEIAGYYVSDAYTTQYYLEDLLTWFIFEATFFGWERESVEEESNELKKRAEEVESGEAKTVPADEVFEELGMGTEWFPEERNPKEKEAEMEIYKKMWAYSSDCIRREIESLRQILESKEN